MRGVLPIIILSIFLSISYYLYNSNVEYGKYAETLVEYREEREKFSGERDAIDLSGLELVVLRVLRL